MSSKAELRKKVREICREGKFDSIRVILFKTDDLGVQTVHDIIQQKASYLMSNNRYVYGTVVDYYISDFCDTDNVEVVIEAVNE